MPSKICLQRSLFMAGIAVAACSVPALFYPFPVLAMTAAGSQISQLSKPMDPGVPVRIEIPKIHADAAIESVGTTTQGAVGVPEGPADAAWFDLGPRPGEEGSSIIVGHSGWKGDIPAVFDDLGMLAKGDNVYVVDEDGATTTFIVSGIKKFNEHEAAIGVFDSSDGKAHLNLITCEGVWNKAKKSYPNRLVVFADRVDTATSTP